MTSRRGSADGGASSSFGAGSESGDADELRELSVESVLRGEVGRGVEELLSFGRKGRYLDDRSIGNDRSRRCLRCRCGGGFRRCGLGAQVLAAHGPRAGS